MDRFGEQRVLDLGSNWKHTYEVHSCRHCARIVLDEAELKAGKGVGGQVHLADNISDALLARDEGCPLFGYLLPNLMDKGLSLDVLDIDGSKTVYGLLTGRGLTLSHKLGGEDRLPSFGNLKVIFSSGKPSKSLDCDPCSPEAFRLSRNWISTCLSSHPRCRLPPSSSEAHAFTPTRLLQVSEHGVKLVKSSSVGDEAQTWCALSYVWGGDQPVKTTQKIKAAHYNDISFDKLPRAIQDAVRVCRGLVIPYLWVDALCIIQDDEEDLRRELGKMPKIYQHATVTISAAWSRKADDGFLYRRGHKYQLCPPVKLKVVDRSWQGSMSHHGEDEEENQEKQARATEAYAYETPSMYRDPISSRAWTYQEHALSPRVLLYRSTLLEWSCRTISDSYGMLESHIRARKAEQQSSHNSDPFFVLSSSQPWSSIVIQYSKRYLSFTSDKLRALSAIAQVYHQETGKKYLAGLWKEDFPAALCWYASPEESNNADKGTNVDFGSFFTVPRKRPAGYRAPSWSWASIDDAVFMFPAADEEVKQVL